MTNPSSSTRTSSHGGFLALYASIVLFALNGLFAKIIPLDAISVTQTRCVIAALALFLFLFFRRISLGFSFSKESAGVYALGFLLGGHWVTYFHSMQISTVAIGMLSLFCYPVLTVLIEPLFKKQWPQLADLVAGIVVFFGIFLLISESLLAGDFSAGTIQGAFWGIVSAVFFSLRNTLQKHMFSAINPVSIMAHQTLAVAVLLLPFVSITQVASLSLTGWFYLVLLGCVCTALAHTFMAISFKHFSAKTVALIGCNVPLAGTLLAWWLLDEIPGKMVFAGGFLILGVAAYETLKQR